MALTLIKEDGTGKVDANSHSSAADGVTYHTAFSTPPPEHRRDHAE